jgi:hypothetical protein
MESYLGGYSLEGGFVCFTETHNDALGFAVCELPEVLMFIPAALIPYFNFYPLSSDLSL